MKKVIIILALVVAMLPVMGQTNGQIVMDYSGWSGATFAHNGESLKLNQVLEVMKPNPEAYKLMRSAKSSYDFSSFLGFTGGALIGWPLGTAVGGGDPNWALAGIGAGLILVAIPITSGFKKKASEAVSAFNQGSTSASLNNYKSRLEFASGKNGIGFRLSF